MNILTCPVCGEKLNIDGKAFKCANSHSFDIAKQGYVNLLLTNKSGDKKGDSRESAHSRREFLQKGYYSFLRDYVTSKLGGTVLDICCGEGYYDEYQGELYGFDISREMVRLAASARKSYFSDSPVMLAFSWSILMSLNVIFSNVWGILLKEWKGVDRRTIVVLITGMCILILSLLYPNIV